MRRANEQDLMTFQQVLKTGGPQLASALVQSQKGIIDDGDLQRAMQMMQGTPRGFAQGGQVSRGKMNRMRQFKEMKNARITR